ncbi:MAG: DinB family protein [Chloroflexota bacterium]|nr:DinB family protein [Chloroflexota bacterium]
MDGATRQRLVAQYKDGPRVIEDALAGITDAELDARPAPGEWTTREIVHHLADSEMTSAIRLRRLIAEPAPAMVGYDQDEFVRALSYPGRPIAGSFQAFAGARASTAEILDQLSEIDWGRAGTHNEIDGPYGAEDWLRIYAGHAHDHADQIRVARASAAASV